MHFALALAAAAFLGAGAWPPPRARLRLLRLRSTGRIDSAVRSSPWAPASRPRRTPRHRRSALDSGPRRQISSPAGGWISSSSEVSWSPRSRGRGPAGLPRLGREKRRREPCSGRALCRRPDRRIRKGFPEPAGRIEPFRSRPCGSDRENTIFLRALRSHRRD